MEISLILAIIIVAILLVVLPSVILVLLINCKSLLKILGITLFVLYLIGVSVLVFGDVKISSGTVKLTLTANSTWFSWHFTWANLSVKHMLLNLVMMFPISAFLFSLNTKHILVKTIIISFIISLIIELMQFVLPINRTTEVLDVVLNTISGIIGYAYFYLIYKFAKRYEINLLKQN